MDNQSNPFAIGKTAEQREYERNRDRVTLQVLLDNLEEVRRSFQFSKLKTDSAKNIQGNIRNKLDTIIEEAELLIGRF